MYAEANFDDDKPIAWSTTKDDDETHNDDGNKITLKIAIMMMMSKHKKTMTMLMTAKWR